MRNSMKAYSRIIIAALLFAQTPAFAVPQGATRFSDATLQAIRPVECPANDQLCLQLNDYFYYYSMDPAMARAAEQQLDLNAFSHWRELSVYNHLILNRRIDDGAVNAAYELTTTQATQYLQGRLNDAQLGQLTGVVDELKAAMDEEAPMSLAPTAIDLISKTRNDGDTEPSNATELRAALTPALKKAYAYFLAEQYKRSFDSSYVASSSVSRETNLTEFLRQEVEGQPSILQQLDRLATRPTPIEFNQRIVETLQILAADKSKTHAALRLLSLIENEEMMPNYAQKLREQRVEGSVIDLAVTHLVQIASGIMVVLSLHAFLRRPPTRVVGGEAASTATGGVNTLRGAQTRAMLGGETAAARATVADTARMSTLKRFASAISTPLRWTVGHIRSALAAARTLYRLTARTPYGWVMDRLSGVGMRTASVEALALRRQLFTRQLLSSTGLTAGFIVGMAAAENLFPNSNNLLVPREMIREMVLNRALRVAQMSSQLVARARQLGPRPTTQALGGTLDEQSGVAIALIQCLEEIQWLHQVTDRFNAIYGQAPYNLTINLSDMTVNTVADARMTEMRRTTGATAMMERMNAGTLQRGQAYRFQMVPVLNNLREAFYRLSPLMVNP